MAGYKPTDIEVVAAFDIDTRKVGKDVNEAIFAPPNCTAAFCAHEMLLNYLPVGSERAALFYAECALEAGVALINCIPVFIASNAEWAQKSANKKIPIIGDDIKAQLDATITHRTLLICLKSGALKSNVLIN